MLAELKTREFENKVIGKLKNVFRVTTRSTGDIIYDIKDKKTGRFIFRTKRSQQRRIKPWIVEQIKKQLFMTRRQFVDFKNCPLSANDYRNLLLEKGKI